MNKEDQLIEELNTISPRKMLSDLAVGGHVSRFDLELVDDLRALPLNDGVINVLLHFVILNENGRLSRQYVLKLGAHWSRVGIETVEDAMQFAKEEKARQNRKTAPRGIAQRLTAVIDSGATDVELGKYVRNLLRNDGR